MSVDYRLQGRWARSLQQQDELRRLIHASSRPQLRPVPNPAPRPSSRESPAAPIELRRTPW